MYADQGFCLLLLKERPFDFYGVGGGQEVHADQCLWFKLHKKRPFDYNGGGGGRCQEKKVKDIFQNNIQDLGLILL